MDAVLWAVGAYAWIDPKNSAARDKFWVDNWLNPKQMEETYNLMQQLAKIIATKLHLPKSVQFGGSPAGKSGSTISPKKSGHTTSSSLSFFGSSLGGKKRTLEETQSSKMRTQEQNNRELKNRSFLIKPKPNTPQQLLAIKKCVLMGLIDHIGRQSEEERKFYLTNTGGVQGTVNKIPALLHNTSNLFRQRPRPNLVAFDEVTSALDRRDPTTRRFYLRGYVAVESGSLAKLFAPRETVSDPSKNTNKPAAVISDNTTKKDNINAPKMAKDVVSFTNGGSPLVSYADILQTPLPQYFKDRDQVIAFVSPKYLLLDLTLPTVEVVLPHEEPPASDNQKRGVSSDLVAHEKRLLRYKVFARALLEGQVFVKLRQFSQHLTSKSSTIVIDVGRSASGGGNSLSTRITANPKALNFVNALYRERCCSGKRFLECLAASKKRNGGRELFLLKEYLEWVPKRLQANAKTTWETLSFGTQ